jgi:DNA-directed RNA polymerase subunit F
MSNHSTQEDEDVRDPATRAFDALRDELARVRHSMENLHAGIQQSRPHDYRRTLGEILRVQEGVEAELHTLKTRPAIQYTPESFSREMERERSRLVEGDKREIRSTIDAVNKHSHQLNELVQRGTDANAQSAILFITALFYLILGSTLFLPIAAFIARLMPESMNMPESMASYILDLPMQKAGIRLIYKNDPKVWENVSYNNKVMSSNSDAIEKCKEEMLETKKEVKCMVILK